MPTVRWFESPSVFQYGFRLLLNHKAAYGIRYYPGGMAPLEQTESRQHANEHTSWLQPQSVWTGQQLQLGGDCGKAWTKQNLK